MRHVLENVLTVAMLWTLVSGQQTAAKSEKKDAAPVPTFSARLQPDGEHLSNVAYPDDLMDDTLAPSVRKLPSALDVEIVNALRTT